MKTILSIIFSVLLLISCSTHTEQNTSDVFEYTISVRYESGVTDTLHVKSHCNPPVTLYVDGDFFTCRSGNRIARTVVSFTILDKQRVF